jgi:DNA processing protein
MYELRECLALSTLPRCGLDTLLKLLKIFVSPQGLLSASASQLRKAGASELLISRLKKPDWQLVNACINWQETTGGKILHWWDTRYPSLLREIYYPPLLLFVLGDSAILAQRQLAIVGSRHCTPTGLEIAHQFAGELAEQGFIITSGLARGIDGASHKGCLAVNRHTVAVLGSGLNKIYPTCHTKLAQQIVATGGALVSEFFPNSPPKPEHFPRRNRIISGLSLGVIVIEASLQSGSLITANYALEQGREVFAVPGSIRNPLSQGCHALLKQGANLMENSNDIFLELGYAALRDRKNCPPTLQSNSADDDNLDSEDKKLVECVGFEMTTVDTLEMRTGFTTDKLLAQLAWLELKGYISAVPGGYTRK